MIPKNTILLADDEEELLTMLEMEFSSEGYQVLKARSGQEAVRKAVEFRPNLIVLDILMPDLDGGQVAKILKSNPITKNVPVIFLTAVLTKEEEKAKHMDVTVGSASYPAMAKPFDPKELLAEIRRILNKPV
jgi:DNA-binding response OmpR family regulator